MVQYKYALKSVKLQILHDVETAFHVVSKLVSIGHSSNLFISYIESLTFMLITRAHTTGVVSATTALFTEQFRSSFPDSSMPIKCTCWKNIRVPWVKRTYVGFVLLGEKSPSRLCDV